MFVPPLDTDSDYQLFVLRMKYSKYKGGSQHLTEKSMSRSGIRSVESRNYQGIQKNEQGGYDLLFTHQDSENKCACGLCSDHIPFYDPKMIYLFRFPCLQRKGKCIA